jgi:Ca2+-transporting ATPase
MPYETDGLTSQEARARLNKFGPNALPQKPAPSDLSLLLSQMTSPLVYVLIGAGVVTVFLEHVSDSVLIFGSVLINTILGYLQEKRAGKALQALKELIHPEAKVVRDGKEQLISVEEVVPGDIVVINQGDKVPADGKLLYANRLFVSEAILTGESLPLEKSNGDEVFMGTVVSGGQGRLEVDVTGAKTQMGKIALSVQEPFEDTPLRKQLSLFSKQLVYIISGLIIFIIIVGLATGRDFFEILVTAVALAVSSIPEGLLVGMTVVLAIGMQRILAKKGLVRNLVSAETLGGVTTICIDKTGTLTQGRMKVDDAYGDKIEIAKQAILANDKDDPIVMALWEWANKVLTGKDLQGLNVEEFVKKHKRLDSIPFSSNDRYFASLNKTSTEEVALFVNGAPEFLLDWCNMGNSEKDDIKSQIEKLTSEGKRIVGMARKNFSLSKHNIDSSDIKQDLTWVGLISLADPVRVGVKEALEKTKRAGIKLVVITGDYTQTALSVMKSLDIQVKQNAIILGSELDKFSLKQLGVIVNDGDGVKLFARTTPEQKLKIVEALKKHGEVVAMMGDGVNDAPALNMADIGIVVGEASDVAKESADLVLLDSSFTTIIAAIEEGRGIFANIRKILLYLLSDAFEEIIAVIITIFAGLPLPVTAAQILWINLISDGFPDLALTVDPKDKGIMNDPPRSPKENLVTPWIKELVVIVSVAGGFLAALLFIYYLLTTGDLMLARSIAFAVLGLNSLVYVFSIKTLRKPAWTENPFDNKWLNVAVIAGFVLQILPFLSRPLRKFMGVEYLALDKWIIIFATSIMMFIIIEVSKHLLDKLGQK